MKVRASVKESECKIVRRKEIVRYKQKNPRFKQRQG
jgi:ribosomal protein L36